MSSGKNQADQDKLDYERKQSNLAHENWQTKYATDKQNITDQYNNTLKELKNKYGTLTNGDATAFSTIQDEIKAGGRITSDKDGNALLTAADGTVTNLTDKYGSEGATMAQQSQDMEDAYSSAQKDWTAKYTDAERSANNQISTMQGSSNASASASGLSIDSSSLVGQLQQLANAHYAEQSMSGGYMRARDTMDKQASSNEVKLSTGWGSMAAQALQIQTTLDLNKKYASASLENANTYEGESYSLDQSYYDKVQKSINDAGNRSALEGILAAVEIGVGGLLEFVPGGQVFGTSLILAGLGTAFDSTSGNGGAGIAKSIASVAGDAATAWGKQASGSAWDASKVDNFDLSTPKTNNDFSSFLPDWGNSWSFNPGQA